MLPYFKNFQQFMSFIIMGDCYETHTWRNLYYACGILAPELDGRVRDEPLTLEKMTRVRLLAPVYEMYYLVEVVGVYSNDQIARLENEMTRIVEEAVSRGLLNEACVPEEEIRKFIDISPEMGRLLWPKHTRDLMDLRDALEALVKKV